MSDLSHTIVVQPNLFIRTFIAFYDCEGASLNTCLLFWGTLGMILLWPFRLLLAGIGVIAAILQPLVSRWKADRLVKDAEPVPVVEQQPKAKGPSTFFKLLVKLAHAGSYVWFKYQTPITWAFRLLVGAALLFLVGLGVYALTTVAWNVGILWSFLEFVGILIIALVIGFICMYAMYRYDKAHKGKPKRIKKHTVRRIYRSVHDHTCANVVVAGQTNTGSSSIQEA